MSLVHLPPSCVDFFMSRVEGVLTSGSLAESTQIELLKIEVGSYFDDKTYVMPTSSNGTGLMAVLRYCSSELARSDVLLQANTMSGLISICAHGNTSIAGYIDCDYALMPTLKSVQRAVIDHINNGGIPDRLVVVLSHLGGLLNPDLEDIQLFLENQGVVLVEDCAHSWGIEVPAISKSLASVYSLYSTKAVPAGEGGLVVTTNRDLGDWLNRYVIYDRVEREPDFEGMNIRISEVQALLARAAIQGTSEITEGRRIICDRYFEAISNKLGIKQSELTKSQLVLYDPDNSYNYNGYKFTLYTAAQLSSLSKLDKQYRSSCIYDYVIDQKNITAEKGFLNTLTQIESHICLPTWYNYPEEKVQAVIDAVVALL